MNPSLLILCTSRSKCRNPFVDENPPYGDIIKSLHERDWQKWNVLVISVIVMKQHQFIFSDERKYRIRRHVIFWLLWWLFMAWLYGYVPYLFRLHDINRFLVSFIDAFFFLAPHMFMAYALMYFVIPRYIVKGKYVQSALGVIVICWLTACISAFIAM